MDVLPRDKKRLPYTVTSARSVASKEQADLWHLVRYTERLLTFTVSTYSACLCSIVSLQLRTVLNRGHDDVWNALPVIVVGTVEFNIGIICSCLPTLPALFRRSNFMSRKAGNKASYEPSSGNSAAAAGGAGDGLSAGSKKGFGRLGDVGESKDSVAALDAGRRGGNEDGAAYEMNRLGDEEEGRKREWFKQARM
ncbi:MAG: hypothetical protein Q9170_001104 [Blastenia crenularia]